MDPQFHDESEIHPNSPRAPWARRVPDGVPRPGPYDPPPPRPSLVPLVVLVILIGVQPELVLSYMHTSVEHLLGQMGAVAP